MSEFNLHDNGRNNEEDHVLVPEGYWHNIHEYLEENELNWLKHG